MFSVLGRLRFLQSLIEGITSQHNTNHTQQTATRKRFEFMGCTSSQEAVKDVQGVDAAGNGKPQYPLLGTAEIMKRKAHGTSATPVQDNLRWGCDHKLADRICNYNRHFAEHSRYYTKRADFLQEFEDAERDDVPMQFFDSNTGHLLFEAPKGRTHKAFLTESEHHGWPSFRDNEVNWEYVRCLKNGECVSIDGTHLGHNLADGKGNRYCINLVSIAGRPVDQK